MTKVWARELGPQGITVNAIAPGFIATSMVEQMPERVLAGMVARTPVGRIGEPTSPGPTCSWPIRPLGSSTVRGPKTCRPTPDRHRVVGP